MIDLAIIIISNIAFYLIFASAHGWLSIEKGHSIAKDFAEVHKANKNWHKLFGASRAIFHITQLILLYKINPLLDSILLSLVGIFIGILLYDSTINYVRGLPIWRFIGSVDFDGDLDAFWLKVDKIIPHLVFKGLLLIASIIFYIIVR